MRNKDEVQSFVTDWVAVHMHGKPAPANLAHEVDRLAARLTGDARAQGISGGELNRTLGDIDDYLTGQYRPADAVPVTPGV